MAEGTPPQLDTGVAHVDESIIHNWNGAANGISTMTEVLIHSSNVGMTLVSTVGGARLKSSASPTS